MSLTAAVVKNYLTTFFGLLAGLPTIVLGVFTPGTPMELPAKYTHLLMISGGLGLVGLGLVSKAFNVHSTDEQVAVATEQVKAKQVIDSIRKGEQP